jgi:hypothetical protein
MHRRNGIRRPGNALNPPRAYPLTPCDSCWQTLFHHYRLCLWEPKPPSPSLSQRLLPNRFPVEENYGDHLPLTHQNSNSAHYGSSVGGNTESLRTPDFSGRKTIATCFFSLRKSEKNRSLPAPLFISFCAVSEGELGLFKPRNDGKVVEAMAENLGIPGSTPLGSEDLNCV